MPSRIKDLTNEVLAGDLAALLDTLFLAVDDDSFTDAEKVLWKSLLYTAAITSSQATKVDQALTPQAYWNSLMGENPNNRGIGYIAPDIDIIDEHGDGLVSAEKLTVYRIWLNKVFNQSSSNPVGPYNFRADDLDDPSAVGYDVTFAKVVTGGIYNQINYALPVGKRYDQITATHATTLDGVGQNGGFVSLNYTGSSINTNLLEVGGIFVLLILSADGRVLSVFSTASGTLRASLHINGTIV